MKVAAVTPGSGDRRKAMLQDIATSDRRYRNPGYLVWDVEKQTPKTSGQAKRVVINKDTTTIIDGVVKKPPSVRRVAQIRQRLKKRPPT